MARQKNVWAPLLGLMPPRKWIDGWYHLLETRQCKTADPSEPCLYSQELKEILRDSRTSRPFVHWLTYKDGTSSSNVGMSGSIEFVCLMNYNAVLCTFANRYGMWCVTIAPCQPLHNFHSFHSFALFKN